MTSPRRIDLVSVGSVDGDLLRWLADALAGRHGVPAGPGEPLPLRDAWLDPASGRYDADALLDALVARDAAAVEAGRWVLGVTGADLFAAGRDFVFGAAAQGGAWALVSLARLGAAAGSADPDGKGRRRLFKESVHELGHLEGLGHCDRPECVMHAAREVEDVDARSASVCPACKAKIRDPSGVDRSPPSR